MKFVLALSLVVATAAVYAQSSPPETGNHALPDLRPSEDWQEVEAPTAGGLPGRAWSDVPAGCYASVLSAPAGKRAGVETMSQAFASGLGEAMSTSDSELRDGVQRLALENDMFRGIAALWLDDATERRAYLLACYWNQREPALCKRQCDALLDSYQGTSL